MANVKISQLSSAAALTGSEEVAIVQSNATVKTTAQDIANLASGGGGLTLPTVSFTPAFPSFGYEKYYISATYDVCGTLVQPTKYGYAMSSLQLGPVGMYYSTNQITALSTDATVIDQIPFGYIDAASVPNFSLPTVQLLNDSNGNFGMIYCDSKNFNSVSLPNLVACNTINFNNCYTLSAIDLGSLKYLDNNLQITYIAADPIISLGSLTTISQNFTLNFASNNISLPLLKYVGYNINIELQPVSGGVQTLNLPLLETMGGGNTTFNIPNLQQFSLPNLKYVGGCAYVYFGTALNEASVDSILASFAALDGTNGTTSWNCGTLILTGSNSAPSAAGLASVAILQGRGIGVSTN